MTTREVWFAIPSANPELCRKTLPAWRERGYKVAVLQNHARGDIPADLVRWIDHYPGWAGSINLLAKEIVPRTADIIVSGGDDMLPDPSHTAGELADQFFERFPDGFGVMQPHGDTWGMTDHYCGSPWLGRGWIESANGGNGPMNAEYFHNWADCELYWVAKCLGALWSRPDLSQKHEHFLRNGQAKPDYWQGVERNGARGLQTLLKRKHEYFPDSAPIGRAFTFDKTVIDHDSARFAERRAVHYLTQFVGDTRAQDTMHDVFTALANAGVNRIALYGAGTHTRSLGPALMDCPIEIACVIDDNAAQHGRRLWGFQVVSAEAALAEFEFDAVVLSADSFESAMWERRERFTRRGVPVLRVYTGTGVIDDLHSQRRALRVPA